MKVMSTGFLSTFLSIWASVYFTSHVLSDSVFPSQGMPPKVISQNVCAHVPVFSTWVEAGLVEPLL